MWNPLNDYGFNDSTDLFTSPSICIEIIERPGSGNSTDENNSNQSESPKQINQPMRKQSNIALLHANRQRLGLGRNVTKTPTELFLARPYCDQFESQAWLHLYRAPAISRVQWLQAGHWEINSYVKIYSILLNKILNKLIR